MPKIAKFIYKNCETHRGDLGLNLTEAQKATGVSRDSIRSIEQGNPHKKDLLRKIITGFNKAGKSLPLPLINHNKEVEEVKDSEIENSSSNDKKDTGANS